MEFLAAGIDLQQAHVCFHFAHGGVVGTYKADDIVDGRLHFLQILCIGVEPFMIEAIVDMYVGDIFLFQLITEDRILIAKFSSNSKCENISFDITTLNGVNES